MSAITHAPKKNYVSGPHAGDPEAAPRLRKGARKRTRSVRVSVPDWACNACALQPTSAEDNALFGTKYFVSEF